MRAPLLLSNCLLSFASFLTIHIEIMLRYFAILIVWLCIFESKAQEKSTTRVSQSWLGVFNQTRLSNKWGFWLESQFRTKDGLANGTSQAILRPGITYYFSDDAKFTAGYAFINHLPADNHKNIAQPEHRLWLQMQWHTKYQKLRLMQWVRYEHRNRRIVLNDNQLGDGFTTNSRFRVNLLLQYPLSQRKFEKGTFSLVGGSELMVNMGQSIKYNYFDQNRLFAGFHYYLNKQDYLQIGYMRVFQQLPAGNVYKGLDALRVFYFKNLNLR